jgi:hypothetical protein
MANKKGLPRPGFWATTQETYDDYYRGNRKNISKYVSYPTYRELLKNIAKHIEEDLEKSIFVTRSKRGEWGEWFERWEIGVSGKPKIVKQGWM